MESGVGWFKLLFDWNLGYCLAIIHYASIAQKFSEQQITRIGMCSEILAYLFITLSGILLLLRFCFIWDYLLWFRRFYFYSCIQWPTIQFCFRKPARSCNGRYPKYTISIARHRPANRRTALCRSTSSSDDIRVLLIIFAYYYYNIKH